MDRIKTRFIIAVTGRLSAAPDSNAKTDLIEELSDNLYQRYADMVSAGTEEEAAYQKALEELGDVDELLAYLRSLGPDGELPKQENPGRDFIGEFLKDTEDFMRETISQTKDAVSQAKVIAKDVAKSFREKYPHGFDGSCFNGHVNVRVDTSETDPNVQGSAVEDTALPSASVSAIDVNVVNGDVTLHVLDNPEADVRVKGDVDRLELRLSETGTLFIRQKNTASSFVLFGRSLVADNVELYLPGKIWDSIRIVTVNGDIELDEDQALNVREFITRSASGDQDLRGLQCPSVYLQSASGDIDGREIRGSVEIRTASGDVDLEGEFDSMSVNTASGDVDIEGPCASVRCASASGDIDLRLPQAPQSAELSSKSGDCELRIPDCDGFTLRFHMVSGDLSSDFPMVGPIGAKSGTAVYGGGGERAFSLSTVSGDIILRRL